MIIYKIKSNFKIADNYDVKLEIFESTEVNGEHKLLFNKFSKERYGSDYDIGK